MVDIVKSGANIFNVVFGAVLCCTLAGCTGPLIYRPEKKPEPVAVAAPGVPKKNALPPAPDMKANNATLAGIDTAGAGIRDDVHIWIFKEYTSSKKRTVLMEMAKGLQNVIVKTPTTAEDAKKLEQSYQDALLRLNGIPGLTPNEADEMDTSLYLQSVNTPQRLKAFLQYDLLLGAKATH